jgi:hypothetical protein
VNTLLFGVLLLVLKLKHSKKKMDGWQMQNGILIDLFFESQPIKKKKREKKAYL